MHPFAAEAAACREAARASAELPVRRRLAWAEALRHLIVARRLELTAAVTADVARPAAEVTATDLLPTCAALQFLERRAERLLAPARINSRPLWLMGCRDAVFRRPRGVVGLIGTWNYPLFLNAVPLMQALVAGNGALVKPSEHAPRTAALLAELLREAGVPTGLAQLLPATREAGPALAEADIDFLHFTGSDAVGRRLAARLGERLIPSAMELSGCDALIVRPDAHLALAARAAWYGATLNRGQTCLAVRRVFVPAGKQAEFLAELAPHLDRAKPAKLVTPGQAAQARRLLADAVAAGCRVVGNPQPEGGDCVTPAVIADATPEIAFCREASFAPLLALLSYADDADLLAQEAQCPFALGAAVFTADMAGGQKLAANLRAGAVVVNDAIVPTAHPATPFGGRAASGWGVTQGAEGLLEMTVPQVVTVRRGRFRPHVDAALQPNPASEAVVEGMLRLTHGAGPRERWRGLRQMAGGMRRMGG